MNRVKILAEPMTIMELYNKVAEAAGLDPVQVKTYDCTKISVAIDLRDAVRARYEQEIGTEGAGIAFGMDWITYGPKAEETLEDGTAEYEDGFFKMEVADNE